MLEEKQKEIVDKYYEFIKNLKGHIKIDSNTIRGYMKTLKRNKKAGVSGVRNEMFKVANCTYLAEEITYLFETIINNNIVVII